MNKPYLSFHWFLLVFLAGMFVACTLDPEAPVDERKSKDHGDPARVVLVLRHGHLDGQHFVADPPLASPETAEQNLTYTLRPGVGWAPLPGTASGFKVFCVKGDRHVYELRIRYFDLSGEDITRQFIDNGQDKIHQHFFIPDSVQTTDGKRLLDEDRSNKVYDYLYADTTPWYNDAGEPGTKITGDVNPIGFKGLFKFSSPRVFRVYVRLMHARVSKYNRHDHSLSPYYAPAPGQLQEDAWDIAMRFPVISRAAAD